MKKVKMISICAAVLILSTMIPASGAIRVLNEKETIDEIQNRDTSVEKKIFIGRISDLKIDDWDTSFNTVNILFISYQKSSDFTMSFLGHIRDSDQRIYIGRDFHFKGILTTKFICGIFRYETPKTPEITFVKDDTSKTLMVSSVDSSNVLWSDIINTGTGSCILPPHQYVSAGDKIFECHGQIQLVYVPLNVLLGEYDFTPT